MGSIPRDLELWYQKLHKSDPEKKIQAIDKLIRNNHPEIEDILINIAETEENEKVRIKSIRTLGKLKAPHPSDISCTFKNLLIDESIKIRKSTIRAIVDLRDITMIKYLTKYYYSDKSEGVKTEVSVAINDLLKILDEKKSNSEKSNVKKKQKQKKLINKKLKSKKEIDYNSYIKKFFD